MEMSLTFGEREDGSLPHGRAFSCFLSPFPV